MVEKYSRIDFRDQISRNKMKSYILMFVVFAVLFVLIYVIGMAWGKFDIFIILIFAIIISISYIVVSFYNSDKIAILSVGAKEIKREGNYKQYYDLVEGLTIASGLPMPKLYVMKSNSINAFASGRDPKHSVVCVTEGALEKLDKKELEGVLAHELGHIESYDIRYMTLVAVMVGMISIISEIFLRSLWFKGGGNNNNNNSGAIFAVLGIVLAILAPIVVYFVQLAISRKREFSADANAVRFTRYPAGLIGALKKIKQTNEPEKKVSKAVAPLFFANPFEGIGNTHPPIDKRIHFLEKM
jgi:heat shock protein HtpX